MANYFANFPTINHTNFRGVDITRRFKIISDIKKNVYAMLPYTIKDGERPEDIAYYYYGSVNYAWAVLMANDIIDPVSQWPLQIRALERKIVSKYTDRYKEWLYDEKDWHFKDLRSDLERIFELYVTNQDITWESILNDFAQNRPNSTNVINYKPFYDYIVQPNASDINDNGAITSADFVALKNQDKWTGEFRKILLQLYTENNIEREVLNYTRDDTITHNVLYYEGRFPNENEPVVFNNRTYQANEYAEEGSLLFGATAPLDASWSVYRIYEYETIQNENARNIKLIKKDYIARVQSELGSVF